MFSCCVHQLTTWRVGYGPRPLDLLLININEVDQVEVNEPLRMTDHGVPTFRVNGTHIMVPHKFRWKFRRVDSRVAATIRVQLCPGRIDQCYETFLVPYGRVCPAGHNIRAETLHIYGSCKPRNIVQRHRGDVKHYETKFACNA